MERMDAKSNRERMLAAKATADIMRQKKQLEKANEVFGDAKTVDQVLAYLAGGASLCWDKRPTGVFQSEMALALVEEAKARILVLIGNAAKETAAAFSSASVEARGHSAAISDEFETEAEAAERMERENHA